MKLTEWLKTLNKKELKKYVETNNCCHLCLSQNNCKVQWNIKYCVEGVSRFLNRGGD